MKDYNYNENREEQSAIFNFVLMITPPCDHIGRTVHPAYNYIHANYKFKY